MGKELCLENMYALDAGEGGKQVCVCVVFVPKEYNLVPHTDTSHKKEMLSERCFS